MNKAQRKELLDLLTEQVLIIDLMEKHQRRIAKVAAAAGLSDFSGKFYGARNAIQALRNRLRKPTKAQARVLRYLARRRVMRSPEQIQSVTGVTPKAQLNMRHGLRINGLIEFTQHFLSDDVRITKRGIAYAKEFCADVD